ncbi:MAG: MmcQ/YjbR family DNA-binding protein [Flavobacteriales bacterium]|nr:MmcQ/YjbR family DNA-binding protein [Flavobacteriales bacterium]
MNIEELRTYCISKEFATESFPFDESTLVFKVVKMFALVNIEKKEFINLKNDPDENLELRASYEGIKPGYHMSKKHWNSVYFNHDVDDELLKKLIDTSYEMIRASLTKKERENLK